jgi:hypothetical protein
MSGFFGPPMSKVFFPSCLRKITPTTLAHTLLGNMGNVAFVCGACMTKTLGRQIPALDFTLSEKLPAVAEPVPPERLQIFQGLLMALRDGLDHTDATTLR